MTNILESENKFHQYVNHALNYFENKNINDTDYFTRGTHLIFTLKEIQSSCKIYFNDSFFFIFEYKIYNNQNTNLEDLLLNNFSFLLKHKKIYSHKKGEIILKSEISENKINELKKLFVASLNWDIKLLNESHKTIDEVVELVYFEFKDIIEKVWRTLDESFEKINFDEMIIKNLSEKNDYTSQKSIRDYALDIANQHLIKNTYKKKKKNWVQKMYILGKRIGIFK